MYILVPTIPISRARYLPVHFVARWGMGCTEIVTGLCSGGSDVTTTTSPSDNDPTESLDSVLAEFSDANIDFTPRPIRDVVLKHLPSWLREAAEKRQHSTPNVEDTAALARCLLDQARVLVATQRYSEAAPKIAEAEGLYRDRGTHSELADCYHIAAELHRGLGEIDKALDYLRKEEEIRRRIAA
jgi:tetratricopeptide (TPR) repeat protein